jgi:uncharacterized protein YbjT (DUF2867 family)
LHWVSSATAARHIVLISHRGRRRILQVNAIDRVPLDYFGMKLTTERVVEQASLGWTTLRAAQFHDLILTVPRALRPPPPIAQLHDRRLRHESQLDP